MKKHSILKRLGSGFLAGLCAASMIGTNLSGIPTEAAESTENTAFPSADAVIAQAANLLGSPYSFGCKGYTGVYYQGSYKPLTEEYIRTQGIDCSGLVYYTLTHLGYSTSGFDWNNPVPVDTVHWLSMDKDCTITYGGVTSKLDIEKQNIKTEEHPYWECADGSTITAGSVVVSETKDINHAWIYMGEFENRDAVVQYLRSIGVSEHLITDKTVGSGNGSGGKHWRIESNGSQGVVINNNTDGKNTSALNTSAFRIAQADVHFTLCKVDAETSMAIGKSSVDGSTAVYGIYSDNACKNKVAEITIGEDGMGSVKLKSGTYYAKEISAPTGYALDETVYTLSGSGTVTVKESPSYGKILVNKTAEDGVIGGRTFEVVNNTTGERWTEVTNENGVAVFGDDADERLLVYDVRNAGTACDYTISEVNVDSRYNVPKAQNVSLANGTVDLTVTAAFVNELKTGGLKINKLSEDGQNGDRTFTVTGGGNSYIITTGADGTAILSDIPVFDSNNEKIVYTISEQDVPVRYVVPADQTATLTADATVDVSFENVLKKFTVEVTKEDAENAAAQGNATLSGAVYGIYENGELVDTYTTDENGSFVTGEYLCGENWTICEITPSEGYLLDPTVYEVGAEPQNFTISRNSVEMTVYESPVKGKISIIKHSDDGTTQIETPEAGAEFDIYLKSAGSYEAAKESERDHLICDENGYAQTKMLPYGIYVVHQTAGWENTEWMDDFEVNVCENEKDYFYIINDAVLTSHVKIVKKDAETGNIIPVSGIGFQVWDVAKQAYVQQEVTYPSAMLVDTFYTDETGTLMLPNELVYGDYELHEVQAANGYVLDKTAVPFTIDGTVEVLTVEKTNTPQKGKIAIQKTGDSFVTVSEQDGRFTPVFDKKPLAGAEFEIVAAEDIVTADGTLRLHAGEVADVLVTDENGYAASKLLYLGKYEICEKTAPAGYVLDGTPQIVELAYAGQEIEVRETVNTTFWNDHQGVEISLAKAMEHDELFGIGGQNEYLSVRFGLFADEELTAADGSVIPADGLISEITLCEDMTAKFSEKLPFGRYYVQEIATDEHYVLNGEKYLVNFEYMGQEMTTVSIDCGQFENKLIRGTVSGLKVDPEDEPLEDALFGLFEAGTEEFSEESAIMTAVSDENGYFAFESVPYGEYAVKEIAPPAGYVLSDAVFPVTIDEDGDFIEITAENEPVTVEISKQDVYGKELEGAKMQLLNENSEVVEEWTSDGTNHVVSLLSAGKYTLHEVAAPDGYVIATDIAFEILEDGTVNVENVDASAFTENGVPLIVMVDDTTKVEISKRDITSDSELPNAKLQVLDENENVIEEWISTNEPHFIEAVLIAGKPYILRETIAPDGYEIANDVKFTVKENGDVTAVVMYDKAKVTVTTPSVPTGDATNDIPAWLMIAGGAVLLAFIAFRKKV